MEHKNNEFNKPPKKKFEFSKLIIVTCCVLYLPLIYFTLKYSWTFSDSTPLVVVIGGFSGIVAAVCNAYYKKAGLENQLKIRASMKKQDLDTSQIDNQIENDLNIEIDTHGNG